MGADRFPGIVTPTLTYLTVDSVQQGVGASQVLPYVRGFVDDNQATVLHTFEELPPTPAKTAEIAAAGVDWRPHRFGGSGSIGGGDRVARGAVAVRHSGLVHARSDLAAAAVLLARRPHWVWDIRSFWIDQRIALGMSAAGSRAERMLRRVEAGAARRSSAITTLTAAAIPELARRHGTDVADKARVVTTCVDLDRFEPSPFPDGPVRLLLSGTFNALYDVDAMLRFHRALQRREARAGLTLLRPEASLLDARVEAQGGVVGKSSFDDMPAAVARHHAGLSICRTDQPAALVAAMPTKIGEFLACGRPVVASAGLGDVEPLLGDGAGVVVRNTSEGDLDRAAHELAELLADPATPGRCREVAQRHFNLDSGIATLLEIYRSIG
jgi:glycosyltransferase involved in cell wall biosynthesis